MMTGGTQSCNGALDPMMAYIVIVEALNLLPLVTRNINFGQGAKLVLDDFVISERTQLFLLA